MSDEILEVTYLHFILETEHYLLTVNSIESIFLLPELKVDEKNHSSKLGELNYQGNLCGVYDMANLFFSGKRVLEQTLDTPIILCKFQDSFIGFLVSEVLDTVPILPSDLSQSNKISDQQYIEFTYKQSFSANVINYELLIKHFKLGFI